MSNIPSIAMIPSAYKSGKLYSVLPSDGVGDFDFSRSGSATRINKDGLIETVSSNVPRLNYPLIDGVVSGCPSLLLEPQRTNLALYSEQFDNAYWSKGGASITANEIISPDGSVNADKFVEDTNNSTHAITRFNNIPVGNHQFSCFFKSAERTRVAIGSASGSTATAVFDLESGTVVRSSEGIVTNASIENFGNGWYRCVANISSGAASTGIYLVDNGTNKTYTGDGVSGVYIWGAQLEQGSYPTSYIPTNGGTVTREAETVSKSGLSSYINSQEGVLYLNTAALADSGVSRNITIYQNTSNLIKFIYSSASNRVDFVAVSGGSLSCNLTKVLSNTIEFSKIALKWKTNDFALWINGVEEATDTSGNSPLGMDKLNFTNEIGTLPFYANVKDLRIYNKALTDAELKALTS